MRETRSVVGYEFERVRFDSFDEYQAEALRTHIAQSSPELKQLQLAVYAMGIAGEAGEVADLLKKHVGHGHPLVKQALVKELGDVLWYITGLAHLAGSSLADVARCNALKLRARYPNGFSKEASQNRGGE